MDNKTTIILLGAILAVGLISLIVGLRPQVLPNITVTPSEVNVEPIFGGENEFYDGVSHTLVSISASSTVATGTSNVNVVAYANSGAQYRRIQNVGPNKVTIMLENSTSSLAKNQGIVLAASSSVDSVYEITPANLYKGIILGIAETSTTTLSVVEK